jgi:predicted nucleic acid-binding protein
LLEEYLATQYYLEASDNTWREAARVYFELRRRGVTLNSPVDCCIAQIALEHGALLLHRDKDFEKISRVRPLEQERFNLR